MKKVQQGFTLIELMIVVAIIGILAAIALPAYQDYMARSQASESVVLLDGARTAIEDYTATQGAFPDGSNQTLSTLGVNGSGKYGDLGEPAQTSNDAGTITYTFKGTGVNKNIQNKIVTYTRATGTGTWSCGSTGGSKLPQKFMPKGCTTS